MPKLTHEQRRTDYRRLRTRFDAKDIFMRGKRTQKTRNRVRETPAWTLNDASVRAVLMASFPRMFARPGHPHFERAARWVRVIMLYHRMNEPKRFVARELGISANALKQIIKTMNRAAKRVFREQESRDSIY